MNGARDLFMNMPMRGRVALVGSVLGVLVAGFLLFTWAGRPSYALALTGLDPAQTGKVTATLDEQGIGYEIRNNGTAVAIDESATARAQIALAEAGLSGTGTTHPGFELVTEQKLGASNFQQKVAYQQALEGELASTIEQIQGVGRAEVRLVLPDDQLFADEAEPSTASVLLGADGSTLGPATIRGIAGLVASSVKGLKTDNVTITDAAGQPLWPAADGAAGAGGTSALLAQQRYARQLEAQVDAMLERTLGPGKAKVQIAATLDMSEGTRERLTYGRRGIPTKRKTETEAFEGTGGAGAGGAAGTAGNVPNYAAGAAGGGESEYERESTEEDLGVDKTIEKRTLPPGQVDRLSVALMVDRSVGAQAQAIEESVAAAVGLDTARGDTINTASLAFAKPPVAKEAGPMEGPYVAYVKYGLIGLAALGFLGFVARILRRAERRPLSGEPVWLREIDSPRPIADLARGDGGHDGETEVWKAPQGEMTKTRKRLEQVVDEDSQRVAATVRAWMQED